MNRRTLLATTGVALGITLGGCLGGTDDPDERAADSPSETTTRPDTTTKSPADGVTVEDVAVRKAVAYESLMGSGGVLAGHNRQYVVATVRADREPSTDEFTFEADGESWDPGLPDTAGATNRSVAGHEGGPLGHGGGDSQSYLAFAVPSPLTASSALIRYRGDGEAAWSLGEDGLDRLSAAAPRFELTGLTVPDEVSQGDPLSATLTVTNVSETDGRFLAAAYWPTKLIADDDESHIVEREVAAGETVTATVEIDTAYTTSEDEPVTLSVRGHATADREVQVRDASGPE